jgi:hypothetical protein
VRVHANDLHQHDARQQCQRHAPCHQVPAVGTALREFKLRQVQRRLAQAVLRAFDPQLPAGAGGLAQVGHRGRGGSVGIGIPGAGRRKRLPRGQGIVAQQQAVAGVGAGAHGQLPLARGVGGGGGQFAA